MSNKSDLKLKRDQKRRRRKFTLENIDMLTQLERTPAGMIDFKLQIAGTIIKCIHSTDSILTRSLRNLQLALELSMPVP